MIGSGRIIQLWLVAVLVGTLLFLPSGLVGQFGYDLAVLLAVVLAIALPIITAVRVSEIRRGGVARRRSSIDYVLGTFMQVVLAGSSILAVPLIVLVARGFWVPHCDFAGGLVWLLLIPGVSVTYISAMSVFFSLATGRVSTALIVTYGFMLLTAAIAVRHLVADPPTFVFNGIVGYVPGPIYDEQVSVTGPLLWARLGTVAWALLFLSLSASLCDSRRHRLDLLQFPELDYSADSLLPRSLTLSMILVLVALHVSRETNGTSPTAGSIQAALGGRVETEHFVIYYDPNANDADEVALMAEDHEFRLAQLMDELGWETFLGVTPLESYVYPTPEAKKRYIGARNTSFADPFDRAMHLNQRPFPHPVLKHELVHVVSASFAGPLGFNPRIGLHEGLAVALDWEEETLTPDEWSAVMRHEGLLPPIGAVTSLRFWTVAASRAYLSAGSFMRFLLNEHGALAVQRFFRDNDYVTHFGAPLDELAEAWYAHLDRVTVTEASRAYAADRLRRRAIFERTCPRQAAEHLDDAWADFRAGRDDDALSGFEQVLRWAPDDAGATLGKLRSLERHAPDQALLAFADSLASCDDCPGRIVDAALMALGDRAWRDENTVTARDRFASVLARRTTPDYVRSAAVKLPVLNESAYRRVLVEDPGLVETGALLGRLADEGPAMGLANYLLGRRLFQEEAWAGAAFHLQRARDEGLPDDTILVECLRLLGEAHYRASNVVDAETVFAVLVERASNAAARDRATGWVERCRWRRTGDLHHSPPTPPAGARDEDEPATVAEGSETAPSEAP